MTTSRRSGLSGPTLSASQLEQGREALRRLEELLPLSAVAPAVREFLRRNSRAQLAASLGNPLELLSDAPAGLRAALSDVLARGTGEHDEDFVLAEAETARAAV